MATVNRVALEEQVAEYEVRLSEPVQAAMAAVCKAAAEYTKMPETAAWSIQRALHKKILRSKIAELDEAIEQQGSC